MIYDEYETSVRHGTFCVTMKTIRIVVHESLVSHTNLSLTQHTLVIQSPESP